MLTLAREYRRLRALGWRAKWAFSAARDRVAFDALGGEVVEYCDNPKRAPDDDDPQLRVRIVPDNDADMDNLMGDTFNPKANPDIPKARMDRERAEFVARVERDGVYGIVGEVWDGERWEHVDSCWGFVGDDWKDSGYLEDCMSATVDAYNAQLASAARDMEASRPDLYGAVS